MENNKLLMVVYNSLKTDARVLRSVEALNEKVDLTIVARENSNSINENTKEIIIKDSKRNSFFNYLCFIFKVITITNKETYDILYAHDYFSAILIPFIKMKNKSIKIVYDSHEVIIPENNNISKRDNFFYNVEKIAIKYVDLLVCANEERARLMKKHYLLKINPSVIHNISILNASSLTINHKESREYKEFMNKEGLTLVYAGALAEGRRIDYLINLVKNIKQETKLLIIGDGKEKEFLKEKCERDIPNRFHFTNEVPYHDLGSILSECDIAYIYYSVDNFNNKHCASNKIYEYASVGLPMIANENPSLMKTFSEYKIGIADDNLNDALNKVISNIDFYRNNCKTFIDRNSWQNEKIILQNAIELLCENR